jgi:hypothetical protein
VRVLLFHPWGRPDPALCGAGRTALAQLDYCQRRGWEVHCALQEIPAWGVRAGDLTELAARFACVKSVRPLRLDCPPVAERNYGDQFCRLLYAGERAARRRAFRVLAAEPWDAFFTTDVTAAPFALALPHSTRKVLAVGDSYARRAATAEQVTGAIRDAEEAFTFAHVEAELYSVFNHVWFSCEADARRARHAGVPGARHVLLPAEPPAPPRPEEVGEHDLLLCGGSRPGELADAEWFYRHVYLPHLRACGVRLALAGPVAERFPVADLRVVKLPFSSEVFSSARVVVAPVCEAAGPHVPVADALACGRSVVTTPLGVRGLDLPDDAVVVIDMRSDPAATAEVIRDLLASADRRHALGERAKQIAQTHTRERFFAALDAAWAAPVYSRLLAEAA